MLINVRGGVQKCESCLHTSLKFERGRRKFPLKPPRSKQAKERVERRRKDRGSKSNPSRMIYLITRVAGMIVCRYSALGKEKGGARIPAEVPQHYPVITNMSSCHDIVAAVRIAYAACTLHHRPRPTVTAAPNGQCDQFRMLIIRRLCYREREREGGGIGSRADGHEGREIKWGA